MISVVSKAKAYSEPTLSVDPNFEFKKMWRKSNVSSESSKELLMKKKTVIFLD